MPRYEIQGADSSPCYHCGADIPLERERWCDACEQPTPPRHNAVYFLNAFFKGRIIDVRAGGLVIGGSHTEDDIPMYSSPASGIYQLTARMMGGEYILSKEATDKHINRLQEINAYPKDSEFPPLESIRLTEKTRIFNIDVNNGGLRLFYDVGQMIVNRAATAIYYYELEELNYSSTNELEDSRESDSSD